MTITAAQLIGVLTDKHEVPDPECADLCFYLEDKNGDVHDLKLKGIGAFDISTDITFTFEVDEHPALMKPAGPLKPDLRMDSDVG